MENESLYYLNGLTNLNAEKFIEHLKSIHNQLENDIEMISTKDIEDINFEDVQDVQKRYVNDLLQMNEIVNDFTMYKSRFNGAKCKNE